MGKMFLFYPVPNVLRPNGKKTPARVDPGDEHANGFEKAAAQGFLDCDNPQARIVMSSVEVAWSDKPPPGGEALTPSIAVNEEIGTAMSKVWADKKKAKTFFGAVPSSRWSTSFRSLFGRDTLGQVTRDDVLFVVGHGSYTGGYLTHEEEWDEEEQYYKVRADVLANILVHNGLPKSHVFVKMNMCFGGGADGVSATYARAVAKELGARGYRNILVGGYQYALLHSRAPRNTVLVAFLYEKDGREKPRLNYVKGTELEDAYSARNNPALDLLMFEKDPYRCWYDAKGNTVRWNEPDAQLQPVPILAKTDPAFAAFEARMKRKAEWAAALKEKGLG